MKTLEFIKELKKQDDAQSNNRYRQLSSITAGKYDISIQGSETHYCSPRETLSPEEYDLMEIAIFKNNSWLHITRSSVLRAFPRYNELCERADGINSRCPVFGYVSVDLINDLYLYLSNH